MKKNVSIFFLALFLCNVVGYYVWFAVEQLQAEVSFAQQNTQTVNIDINDTNEGIFIAKINASLYSHAENTEWEGTGGEFVQNGQYYAMVHQRILNDTLYIYCVANQKKSELANNFESYVKTYLLDNFDKENTPQSSLKLFKAITKDFLQSETPHLVRVSWAVHTLFSIAYTEPNPCLSSNCFPVFAPPPEA